MNVEENAKQNTFQTNEKEVQLNRYFQKNNSKMSLMIGSYYYGDEPLQAGTFCPSCMSNATLFIEN